MLVTVVGLATAVVFPIAPEREREIVVVFQIVPGPENVFRIAPEQVTVAVPRIAREPERVIVRSVEQTVAVELGPLEAAAEIALAIAAFQAVPGPEAGVASGAVPEALMGPARAQAAAGALPVWEARAAALEEEAVVAAPAALEVAVVVVAAVVVAAVAAGGSKS
jgi:hypothetical protein